MDLNFLKQALSVTEPVLLAVTCWGFARTRAYQRLPAFGAYLACRLLVCAPLLVVLYGARLHLIERHLAYSIYYYVYWVGYLVGAGLALLVVHEIFSHLMRPLPGLSRYGLMAFRWVTLTSVLIALAMALYPAGVARSPLVAATGGAMRCMSVLELCLLTFILVSMQTLRLSPRSREFGVSLGLGLIAAADLFGSAFAFGHSTLASAAGYGSQIVVTLGVAVWMIYFIRPEQEPSPVREAPSSLRRWNEIADALAPSAPHFTLTPSPSNFFLQDVERAVDRVLEKNSGNDAS
jgi:hypothetical protein